MTDFTAAFAREDRHWVGRILRSRKTWHGCKLSQALVKASIAGYIDGMSLLIEQKADVHYDNDRAIRCACQNGHDRAVKFLIEKKADVNADNGYCLVTVSQNHKSELVRILVDAKADVNVRNGRTLSHYIDGGSTDMIKFLLDSKADPNANDKKFISRTVYFYGREDVARLLFEAGGRLGQMPIYSLYVLFLSSQISMIRLLFQYGVDVNRDDKAVLKRMIQQESKDDMYSKGVPRYYPTSRTSPPEWGVTACGRIQELIYYGADYSGITDIRPRHLKLRKEAILPYLHERLVQYVRDTGDELLDMRAAMWHIIQF